MSKLAADLRAHYPKICDSLSGGLQPTRGGWIVTAHHGAGRLFLCQRKSAPHLDPQGDRLAPISQEPAHVRSFRFAN
jgi:hypothetical protein